MANIRLATPATAAAIAAIYGPYCEGQCVSFEEARQTAEEIARRVAATEPRVRGSCWKTMVRVIGYAYARTAQRARAYRWR